MPEFQCYRDLYEQKLRQQEALSKQLRRQQRSIKENEEGSTTQRKMFGGLHSLLKCKLNLAAGAAGRAGVVDGLTGGISSGERGGVRRGGGGRGFMGGGGVDEAYLNAINAQSGRAGGGRYGGGAPDIMTLDDRD